MMPAALSRRAHELAKQGAPFVIATVVRAQRPTSVEAGDAALVLGDGTIEGFVGGACAEHSVRAYALKAIETGEAVLLRILPFGDEGAGEAGEAGEEDQSGARRNNDPAALLLETDREDGAVSVQNPCLSGGSIEVFLEPILRAPRVLVEGDTPIARALHRIGPELGLEVVGVGEEFEVRPDDLALVVAGHGREELGALRRGLYADLPYVALVASRRRGQGVIGELRGDGVPDRMLERIDTPAGLDIGARTPAEVGLSILARIVAVRRGKPAAATTAVDPICGMTVPAVAGTASVERGGQTFYFCCEGCRTKFEAEHERAAFAD